MELVDFLDLFDVFENSPALEDFYSKKYALSEKQIDVLNLVLCQRQSLLDDVFLRYFKGVECENK